ncbi:hypothetical protein [Streptomyces sp. SID12488]|uniref:hypothetical protein n=1 Tax=Streptomyces sp. SID12488 TaxID=2706040 RepID=UPI0013D99502|nr:hypothetical protein [Streptomyces sp. SID12488]NEA65655.1 hypothetical protein [Streptomyces sp. SID12488]
MNAARIGLTLWSGRSSWTGKDRARLAGASGSIGTGTGTAAAPDGSGPTHRRHGDLYTEGAR